ncbi:MAG TPA: 7-cyano-7-deazaguanine synthase, partial [Saccharofermentans sp.]|nr:7-cyano-7-deazaguanine synthase [Saccharofermentans sp.]
MKKVMIGMSGGVDSTAATIILMKDGYEVAGATMILTDSMFVASSEAKAICDKLGIKHYEFDMREAFQTRVREYFARSYYEGFTPNPCVVCNREFKFGDFLKKAIELGYDYIAT